MNIKNLIPTVLLAALGLALLAGPAAADDFRVVDRDRHLTIIDDDGERYEMFIDDGEIRVVDDEGEVVTEVDIEEFARGIGSIVEETMSGVYEALAEISQMDFSFDWDGDDGSLRFMIDEDDFDIDIDVDEIRASVAEALEELGEMDFDEDCFVIRDRGDYDADELEKEMESLRDEITELRHEIKQLRRRQHR